MTKSENKKISGVVQLVTYSKDTCKDIAAVQGCARLTIGWCRFLR